MRVAASDRRQTIQVTSTKAVIYIEAEAEAFSEGVVTAVNQLQYIHIVRHFVTERRH